MISKSRFSLIAVIMLVLLGFGFQNQAKGQPGENAQFCPFVEVPIGWLLTEDITPFLNPLNFSGALIGTVENVNGAAVAGMDWQHVDFTDFDQPTPTNEVGAQAVTWWTQKGGRNTYVQVTNAIDIFPTWVHVRILDENCEEIRNFCDFYTPADTHVYDLGDLITNQGSTPDDNVLQGREGFLTVTAVDDCPSPDLAFAHNALAVTVQIIDDLDYSYGYNANHRWGVCEDIPVQVFENRIFNGSFQDDEDGWNETQNNTDAVVADEFEDPIPVPSCSALNPENPDCDDPDADLLQGFAYADNDTSQPGYYGQNQGDGIFGNSITDFIGSGDQDTNVAVLTSSVFTPTQSGNNVLYNMRFLGPNDDLFYCDNYVAVCVLDVTEYVDPLFTPASFVDCDCYNSTGDGSAGRCDGFVTELGNNDEIYAFQGIEFQGGTSTLQSGALGNLSSGRQYVVQTIVGQKVNSGPFGTCFQSTFPRATTGALVDNFQYIETFTEFLECDGTLTGDLNAYLSDFLPGKFAGQFNKIDDNEAGGDAILINFYDEYLPNYRTIGAFVTAEVGIFDDFEDFQSCGDILACFLRLGIDDSIGISDDFSSPTPTGTVTPPTTTPPTITPTPTDTQGPSGGGGSCAIAGNPVQLGTAFANVLIPLVPVAFAFGVRAVRRRKK